MKPSMKSANIIQKAKWECVWRDDGQILLYVHCYMFIYIYVTHLVNLLSILYSILCMQCILQMCASADYACTYRYWTCVCMFLCLQQSKHPEIFKFLKFKDPIQVKLKLQVTQSWSQLYIIQCHLTEDTLLVCEWWNAEHLQVAYPYSNNGESSLA